MKKKYRFRKMYFICEDKRVIAPNVGATNAYQFEETAITVCSQRIVRENGGTFAHQQGKPLPKLTVEGFYLVPAQLFKEMLEPFADK